VRVEVLPKKKGAAIAMTVEVLLAKNTMSLGTIEAKVTLSSGIGHLGIMVELDFTTDTERYGSGTHPISWASSHEL